MTKLFGTALAAMLVILAAVFPAQVQAEVGAGRFVASAGDYQRQTIARYGPFQVVDAGRAILVDVTDEHAPDQFLAMLRDFPAITTLALVECPGTFDDLANLRLGRLIRAAGLAIHVPRGGSVRSGAVELVMAGASLRIDDGAEFAVHAWIDDGGLEAHDYAASAPENRKYLNYYREMGMADGQAASFYAMTNSVPNHQAKWLDAGEMRGWLGIARARRNAPQLALPEPELPEPELAQPELAQDVSGPKAPAQADLNIDLQAGPGSDPQLAYLDLATALN